MISVIVPVYKVEKYLRQCLDSLINQTYRNIEIILVDDGSPDNCGSICDAYAMADDRIKVIHKPNGGRGSARNAGMDIATGDYLAFVDSDDWLDLDTFEVWHKIAAETGADIVEGSYRHYRPWKPEAPIQESPNTLTTTTYTGAEALERLYASTTAFSDIAIMIWNKLYKASILKKLRFLENCMNEDVGFVPQALYAAKKVVKYDRSFYTYNIHIGADSARGASISVFSIDSILNNKKLVMDFFAQKDLDTIRHITRSAYYYTLADAYYQCWCRKKEKDFAQRRKELRREIKCNKKELWHMQSPASKWSLRLLAVSPSLYCIIKSTRT